jgi:hypothetical protein
MRKVFPWELLSGGKPYIILLILFLLMYVATDYPPLGGGGVANYDPKIYPDPFKIEDPYRGQVLQIGPALDIGWNAFEVWWFSFPVVIALAVLLFSYDIDRGLLRTYMLSRASRTSLFIGKLAAMFVAVYIPLVVSGALILALADPTLFLADPLLVWGGLWLTLQGWALMMYVMVGFSVFSAVALKKPLYAFVTPYVAIYAIGMVRLPPEIGNLIPPRPFIFIDHVTRFWSDVWPSLATATALLVLSYIIFTRMEQP